MRREERRDKFLCSAWGIVAFFLCASFQGEAMADITGYLDLTYIHSKTKEETPDGNITDSKGNTFLQRYSLTLTRDIYPNLRLATSGIFEKNLLKAETNGVESEIETRIVRPLIQLSLRTPPYFADLFYTRREDRLDIAGGTAVTNVAEVYKATFSWNSVDYPTGKFDFSRTNSFDTTRTVRDITTDDYTLKLDYSPLRRLTLRSRSEYQVTTNRVDDVDSNVFTETGTVAYDTSLFKDRVTLGANYEFIMTRAEASRTGSGEFLLQVFPLAGLSAIDTSPSNGPLDLNSALIDGERAVGAGINIGLPPPGGNTGQRNIGLDFFQQRQVDTFHLWIDREIPPDIANSFTWGIYTSPDNQNWEFVRSVAPAVFDPARNFFEIQFPPIMARFIKVVVEPLSLSVLRAAEFPTILVTEMEAFLRQSPDANGRDFSLTSTSHNLNSNAKVIFLYRPLVFYDASYSLLQTGGPISTTRWSLTNGVNVAHAFSEVFSGSARVSRDDLSDPGGGKSEVYRSSVSLTAVPLRKLSHTLTLSWSREKNPEGTSSSKQLFLDNIAGLYRGLDVFLNGGLGTITDERGMKRNSSILNAGTQIVPHPSLILNMHYFFNETKPADDSQTEEDTVFSRTAEFDVTFSPVRSLSLSSSLSRTKQQSRSETLRKLSANWAPFAGGALIFSFNYSEELRTSDNNLLTTLRPSIRWNVTPYAFLDVSYLKTKSDGDTGKETSEFVTTQFNMRF